MRILFVDDDEVTLFLYRRLVKAKAGLEVHYARNGAEAMDWIEEAPLAFDAVFLDINMPVMDGYEFIKRHEELPKSKKAKHIFVMLGTEITEENKNSITISSVTEFVNKPLREERFSALLALISK